ncbi:hypothetical protein BOH66_08405 [Microbacterium aurum]|uniref:SprT-like domain-containing protein n=1 Tax=Microbacterium aurum TaxID=36805 RepID=A0A1P8U833_9MICO|nr:hypothetical protein [Microbacterium aurum]APZ34261.1 hypothetical protein BOH66_08405 [Microbacterium aurum]MBM7828100.1 hypothetical protein [Microbacterium aurum]
MTRRGVSALADEIVARESESGQDAFAGLSTLVARIADEVCVRNESQLAGLTCAFRSRVVVVLGGRALGPYGSYQPEKWQLDERALDEIHVNIGVFLFAQMDSSARAEEIFDTICHELAHLYTRVTGQRGTSGRGNRYHNRIFARIAVALGLRVERSPRSYIGHITTGLSTAGWERYADLVLELEQALRLLPADQQGHPTSLAPSVVVATAADAVPATGKYVSAQCGCRDERGRPRTLRMARGWWLDGTVGCSLCQQVFIESPPTRTSTTSTTPAH